VDKRTLYSTARSARRQVGYGSAVCSDSIVKLNSNFSNSVGASGYKVRWCEACQTTYQCADYPLVWSAEPSPCRWPYQAAGAWG
jgi:hypothetical protein